MSTARRFEDPAERRRSDASEVAIAKAGEVEELLLVMEDVEQGLRDIDFPEVTLEDRITFVQAVVAWQVRRALARSRFDLAVRIRRYGSKRIALLGESAGRGALHEPPEPADDTVRGSGS